MRVLIVDDEPEVLDLLSRVLLRDGHSVRTATNLTEAEERLAEAPAELLLLDLALGEESGVDFCRALRQRGESMPILMLTAHSEVPRRVEGFEAGADDFLAKPFAVAELRARVRALGRRGALAKPALVKLGDVELDLTGRRATRAGKAVPITTREWAVLELLAAHEGRVITRSDILESIWGETSDAASASLEVIIGRIRRKLGTEIVRTLRGEGYAFGPA